MSHHRHDRSEADKILHTDREILHVEREILEEVRPRLNHIKVAFSSRKEKHHMAPVVGPVTLTSVGAVVYASVVGYDQFGAVFTGPIPTPTFTDSDADGTIATFDPTTGAVTAVGSGVDSITASLTTAEGLSLTDTETVTVSIAVVPPPTPVLTSIKVAFSTTAPVAAAPTS